MSVLPDRRWLTKQFLVIGTVVAFTVVVAGTVHLMIGWLGEDVDMGLVATIIWSIAGGLTLLLLVTVVPGVMLWYRNLQYEIEEDKVIIRKGVLTKVQQNIPMAMITDFRLQRTLYDRALGIGSIQIQTAGQSTTTTGYEGQLSGLADWAALHDDLRSRIKPRQAMADKPAEPSEMRAILEEVRAIRELVEQSR